MKRLLLPVFLICAMCTVASAQSEHWRCYTYTGLAYDVADAGPFIWVATSAGLVRVDKASRARTVYNEANAGLVDNVVNDVELDSGGALWLAVGSGRGTSRSALQRFDGSTFQAWSAPGFIVKSLAVAGDGSVWVAGDRAGDVRHLVGDSLAPVPIPAGLMHEYVDQLTCGRDGTVWAVSRGHHLYRHDDTGWAELDLRPCGVPTGSWISCAAARSGGLWIATNAGVARYDGTTCTLYGQGPGALSDKRVWKVFQDSLGAVWALTQTSIEKFYGTAWQRLRGAPEALAAGMQSAAIGLAGNRGELSVATWNGIAYFDGNAWADLPTTLDDLPANTINDVAAAPDGSVWAASSAGATRFLDGSWKTYSTANSGLPANSVGRVAVAPNGTVWFLTSAGVARLEGTTWKTYTPAISPLPTAGVLDLAVDRHGLCWFLLADRSLISFNGTAWTQYGFGTTAVPAGAPGRMAVDSNGHVWVTIGQNKIARLDVEQYAWQSWALDKTAADFTQIRAVAVDASGQPYVATNTRGILRFDGATWQQMDPGNSPLRAGAFWAIAVDRRGDLWCGRGNIPFELDSSGVEHLVGNRNTVFDGFSSPLPAANVNAFAFDRDGDVWMGTDDGLYVLERAVVAGVRMRPADAPGATTLRVIPNIASGAAMVEYTINGGAPVRAVVDVIDTRGGVVLRLASGVVQPGANSAAIDCDELPSGSYRVRLACSGTQTTAPFVVRH